MNRLCKYFHNKRCILLLAASLFLSAKTHATETLRVYLDWFPSIEFAGMLVALDKGWYQEQGIKLKPEFSGFKMAESVISGDAEIGMHSAHEVIRVIEKGADLKAFAAQYQFNPQAILVAQDSPIKKLQDIKGKNVAIFMDAEYEIYKIMLAKVGLKLTDVNFVKVSSFQTNDVIALFKQKKIDALLAWEFNWTVTFALQGYPVRHFSSSEYGFNFYGIVYFSKSDFITKHQSLLNRFLKVTERGWKEVYKNPELYTKQVMDNWYPKDRYIDASKELTLKQQLLELKLSKRYLYEGMDGSTYGTMSRFKWAKSLDIAKKYQVIPSDSRLKPENLFDQSVLEYKEKVKP